MVQFRAQELQPGITRIYGVNDEQMYLIEGNDKAALIDTGSGVGDLHKFVSALCKKPIIVLISHGHVDHAMGLPQFVQGHMSYDDMEIYREHSALEVRKAYLATAKRFSELAEQDYIPEKQYLTLETVGSIYNLIDADVFDLGGLTIEAVACPGHTPGSMMFLIREKRILFAGDACTFFTMLQGEECLGLSSYEASLRKVKNRTDGKYDVILMSHSNLAAPITLVDEVLAVCEQIKKGEDDKIPFGFLGSQGSVAKAFGNNGISAYARKDGKVGNIVYRADRIWK